MHLPGIIWAAGFYAVALSLWLLPQPPPPRIVTDKYLHVPSTFPMHLNTRGLHRPTLGAESGMSPSMRPYAVAGAARPTSSKAGTVRSLLVIGTIILVLAVVPG
jgi:hypothetical protein